LLDYAHALGFVTSFVTNGLHLTDEVIARLPKKDFGLGLSIDGIESNALLRGVKSKFEIVADKALKLKRAHVDFNVVLTLNKVNIKEAPQLIAWCRKNDIMLETLETQLIGRARNAQGLQLSPADIEDDLKVFEAKEELEDYYEECVDPRAKLYYAGFLQLAYWLDSLTMRCKGARSIAYIAANGDVYPCSNCAGEEILSGGNIRHAPFSLLWAHSFQEMREITWEKFSPCRGCELGQSQYSCSGKCPALSHALNRTYTDCGATPYTRSIVKARTHKYLEMHQRERHGQLNPSRLVHVTGQQT
jgi:radical SAM protein with 4Fe4S-binding SPASM domain